MGAAEIDAVLKAVDLLTTMIQGLTARIAGQPAPDVSGECGDLAALIDGLISGEITEEAPKVLASEAVAALVPDVASSTPSPEIERTSGAKVVARSRWTRESSTTSSTWSASSSSCSPSSARTPRLRASSTSG
jgi:hypothetical protein